LTTTGNNQAPPCVVINKGRLMTI